MDSHLDAQGVLTIDLDALVANWRQLAHVAAPAACGAAVKADAYGIGIEAAVPALARAGCRTYFAAHAGEGVRVRGALRAAGLGDGEARVFILNGFHPWSAPPLLWAEWSLQPVIGSAPELSAWRKMAPDVRHLHAALHVDTGMNRLGFDTDEAARMAEATIIAARAELVMSHLVAAEQPDHPVNARQIDAFERLRRGPLGSLPGSLANSSGILLPQRPHYDLVRPGYALYGGNPSPGHPNPMRAVVTLRAPILQLRDLAAGASAGYGHGWTTRRSSRIATIGVGYADGFPRNAQTLDNQTGPVALVGQTRCPMVGRVSMDLSLVDVTDARPDLAAVGAPVELLGPAITVDDVGAACQTTGYEILTRLGRRYTRVYRGGD